MPYSFPVFQEAICKYRPEQKHALHRNDLQTLNNIEKAVVYLWVYPALGFWYYIHHQTDEMLVGYIKSGTAWIYKPIRKDKVYNYY